MTNITFREREARELMPYDPNVCTYTNGSLRQNVYACLTCFKEDGIKAGICYSCSIQCHSKHELVELFSKREFTCDCGTTNMKSNGACKLRAKAGHGNNNSSRRSSISSFTSQDLEKEPAEDVPSSSNKYNHNFEGIFCSCARPYNPLQETGNMLQCHFGEACGEDWFHDECIMGFKPGFMGDRKKVVIKKNEESVNLLDTLPEPGSEAADMDSDDPLDDEDIEPIPGFPNLDSFDCFICWKCVEKFKNAIDEIPEELILPRMNHVEANSFDDRNKKLGTSKESDESTIKRRKISLPYSIFLKYGFKDKLKDILQNEQQEHKNLVGVLKLFPFLYEEDPIYEPNEDSDLDDDDNSSIYDMGSKILNQLPREKAIESVRAYNDIKSKLTDFLKPFADNGKIVTETEVRDFFKQVQEENSL